MTGRATGRGGGRRWRRRRRRERGEEGEEMKKGKKREVVGGARWKRLLLQLIAKIVGLLLVVLKAGNSTLVLDSDLMNWSLPGWSSAAAAVVCFCPLAYMCVHVSVYVLATHACPQICVCVCVFQNGAFLIDRCRASLHLSLASLMEQWTQEVR